MKQWFFRTLILAVAVTSMISFDSRANDFIRQDVEQQITAILKEYLNNEHVTISISDAYHVFKDVTEVSVEAASLTTQPTSRRFQITAIANTGALNIRGRYIEKMLVPTPVSRLRSDDIISESDIHFVAVDTNHIREGIITDTKPLIGKSAKRFLRANKPIRYRDITEPTLVEKKDYVQMVYHTPNMQLATLGIALENGKKGEYIRVKNAKSGRAVHVMVEGKKRVRIMPVKRMTLAEYNSESQ